MNFAETGEEAYEAANAALLDRADLLMAVWDGRASERGGTGTVVELARDRDVAVEIVWPQGASRG
ncbi:hypothetical protein AB0C34_09060 [Nocardia sp. NPDC049220]|uniref:hypothetical protein n=1 Tax=Nocardia sp. NPDC049220 TaxID=3155273 RepID=UPI0033CCE17D